ncbi:MAG: glycine cleavage T C-terminal barrel domain-containing protein [Oligoflexia bacterium]|nr:glycine cleavage T C-terminal barrel domain-containing protein [Oligoflexia bacterium]
MDPKAEHEVFKKIGGAFELPRGFIKVKGPDAPDFLHRLSSQDIKSLKPGEGRPGALLQSNAMIISLFNIYHGGDVFLLVTDQNRAQATTEHLEKFHFSEKVEIINVTEGMSAISVQGPDVASQLLKIFNRLPLEEHGNVTTEHGGDEVIIAKENDFKQSGFHLFVRKERFEAMRMRLLTDNLTLFSHDLWELLRAESDHFTFGDDIVDKNLVLEAPAEHYVNRDKGCYPGQEVVERVFTYGNVSKKLVGLRISGEVNAGAKLLSNGKDAGVITSTCLTPWNKTVKALAMVKKPFYEQGQKLQIADVDVQAEVFQLPHSFEITK